MRLRNKNFSRCIPYLGTILAKYCFERTHEDENNLRLFFFLEYPFPFFLPHFFFFFQIFGSGIFKNWTTKKNCIHSSSDTKNMLIFCDKLYWYFRWASSDLSTLDGSKIFIVFRLTTLNLSDFLINIEFLWSSTWTGCDLPRSVLKRI